MKLEWVHIDVFFSYLWIWLHLICDLLVEYSVRLHFFSCAPGLCGRVVERCIQTHVARRGSLRWESQKKLTWLQEHPKVQDFQVFCFILPGLLLGFSRFGQLLAFGRLVLGIFLWGGVAVGCSEVRAGARSCCLLIACWAAKRLRLRYLLQQLIALLQEKKQADHMALDLSLVRKAFFRSRHLDETIEITRLWIQVPPVVLKDLLIDSPKTSETRPAGRLAISPCVSLPWSSCGKLRRIQTTSIKSTSTEVY